MNMTLDNFPERLMLRDTELYDDVGGAGQRIFTTAGQGYQKVEYIRADAIHAYLARQPEGVSETDAFNAFRTAYYGANKSLAPDLEAFRRGFAALTAVWHNRPAQEDTDEPDECPICGKAYFNKRCTGCGYEQTQEKAEPVVCDGFVPFPPLPGPLVEHPKLGPMFDRLQMHSYALKMVDSAKAPPAERVRVPDVVAIMEHLPDNRAATRAELIRAMALSAAPEAGSHE